MWQNLKIKQIQIRKEEVKVLFSDDMILYIRNPKNSISWQISLGKWLDTRLTKKKSVALQYINDEQTEKKIRESTPFIIVSDNIYHADII